MKFIKKQMVSFKPTDRNKAKKILSIVTDEGENEMTVVDSKLL